MKRARTNKARRVVRHIRVRRKVKGVSDRPRLAVYRSLSHVYAQIIDDSLGVTLAAASSLEGEVRAQVNGKPKSESSRLVGELIAQRAKAKKINTVVFDRGGYKHHGRVKTLAEAARKAGLVF